MDPLGLTKGRFEIRLVVMMLRMLSIFVLATSVALGQQGAQAVLQKSDQLELTSAQRDQISAILSVTVKEYNRVTAEEKGSPDLGRKLTALRQGAKEEALDLLSSSQLQKWNELIGSEVVSSGKGQSGQGSDEEGVSGDRSLIIPTIEELKNPPFAGAFGPSTGLAETEAHPVSREGYVILTDHTDPVARAALNRLAEYRGGSVMALKSLGTLYESSQEVKLVQAALRDLSPRFVAIAPKVESYRENMHLCMLKLLSGLDEDPELDVFPGYLMASDAEGLAALVERTVQFQAMGVDEIEPASIGAIEDTDARRYRSYQKAKVMQKMFAKEGKKSPAIIITTRQSHTEREDFPDLSAEEGNIAMLPQSERYTFDRLSLPAELALDESNVLFMYGHGTTDRICGTNVDAFGELDFTDELVFCGSCMSASPYEADRVDLESKRGDKRFAYHVIENGAVMFFGHMGLCGGFPKVFPMSELVLSGSSTGEAYQQLMNSIIGGKPIPDYYSGPAGSRDAANGHLYVLWGDPALVPIAN